jgi:hypothetical protein
MSNSEPSAIVLQDIPRMCGLYKFRFEWRERFAQGSPRFTLSRDRALSLELAWHRPFSFTLGLTLRDRGLQRHRSIKPAFASVRVARHPVGVVKRCATREDLSPECASGDFVDQSPSGDLRAIGAHRGRRRRGRGPPRPAGWCG